MAARCPAAIGATMARVLGDAALRRELAAWGPARAAAFGWDTAAATALDAFERICATPRPSPPAAPPPLSVRPSLALVCDSRRAGLVGALLRALDGRFAVTAVVPDGSIADPWTAANFEARDFRWLERCAPRFDHLLYVTAASTAPMIDLIAEHPGVLLLLERAGDAPSHDDPRDLFAAGGFAALIAARDRSADPACRGGALIRHATGVLREGVDGFAAIGPDAALGRRLEEAVRRCAPVTPDPRRELARMLPRAVRDTRPTGDDLAGVARAEARNAAQRRAPALLVDVSALADASWAGDRRAVAVALARAGGRWLDHVRVEGDRLVVADRLIADMLGIDMPTDEPDRFTETGVAVRAGDHLIRIDAAIDGDSPLPAAILQAVEAGAALKYFDTAGHRDGLSAMFAAFVTRLLNGDQAEADT